MNVRRRPSWLLYPAPRPAVAVQARHIALEAICGQVLDGFTVEIDAPLRAQLESAALLREDKPGARHQTAALTAVQRHAMPATISPLDIAIKRRDSPLVREKDAARPTALGDQPRLEPAPLSTGKTENCWEKWEICYTGQHVAKTPLGDSC